MEWMVFFLWSNNKFGKIWIFSFPTDNVLGYLLGSLGWKEGFSLLTERRFVLSACGLRNLSWFRVYIESMVATNRETGVSVLQGWSWEWVWPGCSPFISPSSYTTKDLLLSALPYFLPLFPADPFFLTHVTLSTYQCAMFQLLGT